MIACKEEYGPAAALPGFAPMPRGRDTLLSVPYLRHSADNAGAAALGMVLLFHGIRVPLRNLSAELATVGAGTAADPRVLMDTARNYGFNARLACADLDELARWLDDGVPPLLFLEPEQAGEAAAVVTGVSGARDAVRLHCGAGPNAWLRMRPFLSFCGGDGFTVLLISARKRAAGAKQRLPGAVRAQVSFPCMNLQPLLLEAA